MHCKRHQKSFIKLSKWRCVSYRYVVIIPSTERQAVVMVTASASLITLLKMKHGAAADATA